MESAKLDFLKAVASCTTTATKAYLLVKQFIHWLNTQNLFCNTILFPSIANPPSYVTLSGNDDWPQLGKAQGDHAIENLRLSLAQFRNHHLFTAHQNLSPITIIE